MPYTLASNYWLTSSLLEQGKFDAAQEFIDRTTEIQKIILGLQDEETVKSLHLSGRVQYTQERYEDALVLFEQAADATVGVDYSSTAEVHRSLAQCLYKLKRYQEAGSILDQTLQHASPTPEIAESIGLLFDIGRALHKVGQYGGAQRCFERVSDYSRDLFGPAHEKTINTTIYLASALGHQSDKATEVLGVLLNMPLSTSYSESVFSRLQDVGETLWQQKAYSEAHTTFEIVVRERARLLGRCNPQSLISASWLGRSLLSLAQYEEAASVLYSTMQDQPRISFAGELGWVERRYGDATEIIRSSKTDQVDPWWAKRLDTAYTTLWLAQCLHHQGKRTEATSYARQTYPIFNRNLGDSHKDTIISLRFRGSAEGQVRLYALAEISLRRSLYLGSKFLAPTDEDFIRIRINYGIVLYGIKCYGRALDHLHFGHDHQVATRGKTHMDIIDTLSCIGSAQYELSLPEKSAKSWRQVLEARQLSLGAQHLKTQIAMQSLAFALAMGGIWGEAVSLLELVLRAREETLGPEHPKTMESRRTVQKGRKMMMGGKWMLWSFWPKRRELDCRHL